MRKTSALMLLSLVLLATACQRDHSQQDAGGNRSTPIVLPLIQ